MGKIEITKELLADLKAKAEKAVPGPWTLEELSGQGTITHIKQELLGGNGASVASYAHEPSASYIAAADPTTILALIEAYEQIEKEADWLSEQILCCTDDNRADTCRYEDCRHLCSSIVTTDGWRKAAREAVR